MPKFPGHRKQDHLDSQSLTESDILAQVKAKVDALQRLGVDTPTIVGVIATYFRARTLDRVLSKTKLGNIRAMIKFASRVDTTSNAALDILMEIITKVLSTEEV